MVTNFELELLLASRAKLTCIMEEVPESVLLSIPEGFNNNILWHMGHIVVSQQRLLYMRSGLKMNVSEAYLDNFKKDTSPKTWTIIPDIQEIKTSLLSTAEILKADLKNEIFKTYDPFQTSMGFMVNNYLEAFVYTTFHEAEHTGNIQYMIKIIG
jgi:hypothetical protein